MGIDRIQPRKRRSDDESVVEVMIFSIKILAAQ
jgi:hypothetical protein